ncbi:MAG: hypothetical protein ACTHK2_14640 [Dokdonella sp.]|uniref:hypothetical protein n=1 Tax=Dokdonella sp. TaxID=2291710 RepID=UPI003F7D2C30
MSAVMEEKIKRWTARRMSALVLEIIQACGSQRLPTRPLEMTRTLSHDRERRR